VTGRIAFGSCESGWNGPAHALRGPPAAGYLPAAMRLAIVSDIHGNLIALEAVLADIAARAPDAIVNLGDCATSPLWPRETVELLETLAIPTVRGNHDRWLLDPPREVDSPLEQFTRSALTEAQCRSLAELPPSLEFDGVLAVHGSPASDLEALLEDGVDGRLALATAATLARRLTGVTAGLVLCGHTHLPHFAAAPGGRLVLNPGSVGCPRAAGNAEPFIAEAAAPLACYAIATRGPAGWSVEQRAIAYDWAPVIRQALANGHPHWALGFAGDPGPQPV